MKKVRIFIALFFGAFCILFAACYILLFLSGALTGPSEDLGTGLSNVFGIIFSLLPLAAGVPVLLALAVCTVCMFAVTKKYATAVATLVIMTIYLPAVAFLLYVIGAVFFSRLPILFAAGAGMAALYLILYILACVYLHLCRMQRREECA